MMYRFFIVCLMAVLTSLNAIAQKKVIQEIYINSPINDETVSFTEFLDALAKANELVPEAEPGKSYTYLVKGCKVRFKQEIDKKGMDYRYVNGGPEIIVKPNVRIVDVDFDAEFWLLPRGFTFLGHVWVTNTQRMKTIFTECKFKKSISFFSNESDFIDFFKCEFELGFRFVRGTIVDHMKFDSCRFYLNEKLIDDVIGFGVETRTFLIDNKIDNIDLTIQHSTFKVPSALLRNPNFFVTLATSNFSNIRILKNEFIGNVDLQNSSISNNFQFEGNKLNGTILLYGLNINPLGTRFEWNSVKDYRISLFEPEAKGFYNGNTLAKIPLDRFNNLFSSYSIIYNAFRSQGNRFDANRCYVEWKHVETEYLRRMYQNNHDILVYFTYWMNVFLDIFCDYGTNPLKSIYMSAYVLVIFALLYFFLPNRFGYQTLNFYGVMLLYLQYIRNPKTLLDQETEQPKRNEDFQAYLEEISKTKAPWYFKLVSLPDAILHYGKIRSSRAYNAFIRKILRWKLAEKPSQRVLANALIFGIVVLFVSQNLFYRALDCLALSINLFTTLGFGNTEVKGLPMYLTVIEGFIGWFLLSFFSLSLISQLIN